MQPNIIDLHCDTVSALAAGIDITRQNPSGHCDIPRLRKGGVGIQIFACFVSSIVPPADAFPSAQRLISEVKNACARADGELQLIETTSQIRAMGNQDKIGVILAVENGHTINNQLENLDELRKSGVRYLTITHSKHLPWAASSGEKWHGGQALSSFGEQVIDRMNQLGMIVDVSHVHENTFWAIIKKSKRPVIASHSNCRSICPTERNLSDDQVKAIAGSGGMVGINFYPGFLSEEFLHYQNKNCFDLYLQLDEIERKNLTDPAARYQAGLVFNQQLQERMKAIDVSMERIVDHIAYITNLVGDEYVGFGSDFDGIPMLPSDMNGCEDYPEIILRLLKRGFSQQAINNICYENFLRVLASHDN